MAAPNCNHTFHHNTIETETAMLKLGKDNTHAAACGVSQGQQSAFAPAVHQRGCHLPQVEQLMAVEHRVKGARVLPFWHMHARTAAR